MNSIVPFNFYALAGSTINFALTYASAGGTSMQYELHLRLEAA